ncbi:proline-rich protein 29 isoform X2 [Crotalus tigris]|uniref:proline-rich protein 29 isoform X2 n=1 Tax=Crotalus tigris TaxID=88082 RepID=UPI00192F45C1|nr:proline-rich protein 29 isoform X2 [Crotalus tigris]
MRSSCTRAMCTQGLCSPNYVLGTAFTGHVFLIPQEPEVTILQQMPPTFPQSSCTSHFRENLIELMMIQNAQMHQVIMSNLAMSAAACFESNPSQQIPLIPWQTEDEDEMDMVFHHHYAPYPFILPFRTWKPPSQPSILTPQQPIIRHVGPDHQSTRRQDDGQAVPPPPPPSATGTVTADILPASEYYDYTEQWK